MSRYLYGEIPVNAHPVLFICLMWGGGEGGCSGWQSWVCLMQRQFFKYGNIVAINFCVACVKKMSKCILKLGYDKDTKMSDCSV